ncbi:hypothetical protein J6590_073290 [Homalodisca vitripennis]|nr:hypothetical protein J6590_073290 [Homalodisca vitripennis]
MKSIKVASCGFLTALAKKIATPVIKNVECLSTHLRGAEAGDRGRGSYSDRPRLTAAPPLDLIYSSVLWNNVISDLRSSVGFCLLASEWNPLREPPDRSYWS